MMCAGRVRLATSSRLASVVDLPDPVGPVTSTSPRGRWAKWSMSGGQAELVEVRMWCGMVRNTAPTEPRWRKTLTRKRLTPIDG